MLGCGVHEDETAEGCEGTSECNNSDEHLNHELGLVLVMHLETGIRLLINLKFNSSMKTNTQKFH